ncbi:hypothetical protein H702_07090 [Streptococcus equinus JB1]|uniref:Antirestriction protein n=1 Tax=Streptococcus equinus JB1 TaxID=1294274 RepID=A0A091BP37_STREI|nr:hypothetical protein [Streptococcus equinus]KFN87421.1 hypothetical protein H702_07090 [Streptococcus equinus JB1]QBX15721.1 hypothetical protein Javan207_0035 [Streptococcus phage Javan207]SFL16192.1 hypothetical protein SAMN02910290_00708 [Streptococcus equinus JB1]
MKKLALNTDYIKNGEFWRYGSWNDSTHFRGIESKQGYFLCSSWEELWGLLYYADSNDLNTHYNETENDYIYSQSDRFDGLEFDDIVEMYTEDDYQELCDDFMRDDSVNHHIFFELTDDDFRMLKDDLKRGWAPDLLQFINDHKERENDILEWVLLDAENYTINYSFDDERCKDDLCIWED